MPFEVSDHRVTFSFGVPVQVQFLAGRGTHAEGVYHALGRRGGRGCFLLGGTCSGGTLLLDGTPGMAGCLVPLLLRSPVFLTGAGKL